MTSRGIMRAGNSGVGNSESGGRTTVQSFCAGKAAAKRQTMRTSQQQNGRPGVLHDNKTG